MSGQKAYDIVQKTGMGMVMRATSDLLPGAVVFKEKKPLLQFSDFSAQKIKVCDKTMRVFVAAYLSFRDKLSFIEKKQYCELFGPIDGVFGKQMSEVGKVLKIQLSKDNVFSLAPEELDTFVKVASVWRFNAFNVQKFGYRAVFSLATRMSHSCAPNCYLDFEKPHGCVLRTITPVKTRDELTLEYNSVRRLMPTHRRGLEYAEMKEFTCHCPRCDAEADDTREFDCHDPQCPGSHFACQPINQIPIQYNVHTYTGVEYVEPHLLPCTVCLRAAPLEYQENMLALELQLAEISKLVATAYEQLDKTSIIACEELYQHLEAAQYPRYHCAALGIFKHRAMIAATLFKLTGDSSAMIRATLQYVRCYERLPLSPCEEVASALSMAAVNLYQSKDAAYSEIVQDMCQRVIRMHKVMHGRDAPTTEPTVMSATNILVQLLQRTSTQHVSATSTTSTAAATMDTTTATTTAAALTALATTKFTTAFAATTSAQCMFCGESPLRAALALSKCGSCRQVAYCSVGCQKAHWPVHKKRCGK